MANQLAWQVVVPCTKRKRAQVSPQLHFGSLPCLPPEALAVEWLRRRSAATECRPVGALYAGASWSASLEAFQALQSDGRTQLLVVSAGFGLLRETDIIPPYSATFARGVDQIAYRIADVKDARTRHRHWWAAINRARRGTSTPLTDTIEGHGRCIVALGADYLDAVHDDLRGLADVVGSEDLFLISAGASPHDIHPSLERHRVPITTGVEGVIGGTRSSLNVRAVLWLIRDVVPHTGWSHAEIGRYLASPEAGKRSPAKMVQRRRMDDAEICDYICRHLQNSSRASATALLRGFRDEGFACEQSRFRRLLEAARQ